MQELRCIPRMQNREKGGDDVLKCPGCGRTGGPFRLRQQVQADSQILRGWLCPCGASFHSSAGAERAGGVHAPYVGFDMEWNGRSLPVRLQSISKHETLWTMGSWQICVVGPPSGPGTRLVTLANGDGEPAAQWRLEPGWGAGEVTRRIKGSPPPAGVDPEFLARVIVRLLS